MHQGIIPPCLLYKSLAFLNSAVSFLLKKFDGQPFVNGIPSGPIMIDHQQAHPTFYL
uniref:Uncharacterized protein n=1 Tax=Rhizophora mucronata TaxID=61149 RepID=A0A2P2IJ12_RHIMU